MAKVLKSPLYYRCPESAKTFSSYASWQKHAIGEHHLIFLLFVEDSVRSL